MTKLVDLKGMIVPCDRDAEGNITAIAISAVGKKECVIEMNRMGKSLMQYVGHEVFVEARLTSNNLSDKDSVSIQSYEIQNWKSSEENS